MIRESLRLVCLFIEQLLSSPLFPLSLSLLLFLLLRSLFSLFLLPADTHTRTHKFVCISAGLVTHSCFFLPSFNYQQLNICSCSLSSVLFSFPSSLRVLPSLAPPGDVLVTRCLSIKLANISQKKEKKTLTLNTFPLFFLSRPSPPGPDVSGV